jgi:RNA polymerase sigma factor (sigma-70 family)
MKRGGMLIRSFGLIPRAAPPALLCSAPREVGRVVEPVPTRTAEAAPPVHGADQGGRATLSAEWFREHVNALWRLVARLGVPASNIEDLVQEVFITAWRRRADIVDGQVKGFLFGTAIRLSANYKRRAHVRLELSHDEVAEPSASPDPNAEQLLIKKRSRELLDEALAQLSDAHRTVFVLFELEGLSAPELAELLGVPLGTVASRLQRARAKFFEVAANLQRAADPECP